MKGLRLISTRSNQREQPRTKQETSKRARKTTRKSREHNPQKRSDIQRHHDQVRRPHEHNPRGRHRMQGRQTDRQLRQRPSQGKQHSLHIRRKVKISLGNTY